MAAHLETGTMAAPRAYSSRLLNHLGLVAGMCDELGIAELIDRVIVQDGEKRIVSIGQATKAMVLNGLGFANRSLYLTPLFFRDKPVERLLGEGIEAEHLNDDVLGRALDAIYAYGPTQLYSQVAAQAVSRLGLLCRFGHLDSTGFHTDGRYNDVVGAEEGVIHITKGYSRDHRPDLNQVVLQLLVERQAGIPLLMEPLSGNNSDKESFRQTVKTHLAQLQSDFGLEYVGADSALYTAATLGEMNGFFWFTRVPETLTLARDLIHEVAPELMHDLAQTAFRSLGTVYAGVRQRWVVVYSPAAYQRALKTVNKHGLKQSTAELKAFPLLCRQDFACEADARQAWVAFEKALKFTFIADARVIAVPRYQNKGRPVRGRRPDFHVYRLAGGLASLPAHRLQRLQQKSCFLLATNQLDSTALADEALIAAYKDQQKVERGFRFLKDPMFMASALYLKAPERIMALMMVMTLCLLVYAALEYRIRQSLKEHRQTFPNQKDEPIANPTARWVFQCFAGIHVLVIDPLQVLVLNMNEYHTTLLKLLGKRYEKLYSGDG